MYKASCSLSSWSFVTYSDTSFYCAPSHSHHSFYLLSWPVGVKSSLMRDCWGLLYCPNICSSCHTHCYTQSWIWWLSCCCPVLYFYIYIFFSFVSSLFSDMVCINVYCSVPAEQMYLLILIVTLTVWIGWIN